LSWTGCSEPSGLIRAAGLTVAGGRPRGRRLVAWLALLGMLLAALLPPPAPSLDLVEAAPKVDQVSSAEPAEQIAKLEAEPTAGMQKRRQVAKPAPNLLAVLSAAAPAPAPVARPCIAAPQVVESGTSRHFHSPRSPTGPPPAA